MPHLLVFLVVVVDLPEPQDLELVQIYTENPTFGGTFTNMFYSSDENGIALSATGQIDRHHRF